LFLSLSFSYLLPPHASVSSSSSSSSAAAAASSSVTADHSSLAVAPYLPCQNCITDF
jgi:hypothetical protein